MIDEVGVEDLRRIGREIFSVIKVFMNLLQGRKMLDSKAAVAAIGSLKKVPSYSDIEIGLLDKEVRSAVIVLDGHLSIFRVLCLQRGSSAYSDERTELPGRSREMYPEDVVAKFSIKS